MRNFRGTHCRIRPFGYSLKQITLKDSEMPDSAPNKTYTFDDLLQIMQDLRTPETGCEWDLEQTFATIAPYTIEEAYEVADAIERGDTSELTDELGDLLLQVVFHSQIAKDEGHFDISDVITSISSKMIRRHPHVFGQEQQRSATEQTTAWEEIKAEERKSKSKPEDLSALSGVALALPALLRAEKLQKRAARTGFDWTNPEDIFDKLDEETAEVKDAMRNGSQDDIEEELGDLLFVAANLARRLKVDPEVALRKANTKFERRFRAMEAASEHFTDLNIEEQEAIWQAVKRQEKA
jgi:ATP diphosphatase